MKVCGWWFNGEKSNARRKRRRRSEKKKTFAKEGNNFNEHFQQPSQVCGVHAYKKSNASLTSKNKC